MPINKKISLIDKMLLNYNETEKVTYMELNESNTTTIEIPFILKFAETVDNQSFAKTTTNAWGEPADQADSD